MIKFRLEGTSEELEKTMLLLQDLASNEAIELLSVSGKYANRGKSLYSRMYCDVEIKTTHAAKEWMEVVTKLIFKEMYVLVKQAEADGSTITVTSDDVKAIAKKRYGVDF